MSLMNNFTSKTVYAIDHYDLEQLIKQTFGWKEYSIPAAELCGNDSTIECVISDNGEDIEGLDSNSSLSDVLDEMCTKGLIISGNYLVNVSW